MKHYVEKGARYRARIHFGMFDPEQFVSDATISDLLREKGCVDVVVTGSGHEREAEGTWPKDSQEIDFPDAVKDLERIG